jgi:hypothetical protein
MKYVADEEPMAKESTPAGALREKRDCGEVVPTPTFPAGVMRNEVAVLEPTTNWLVSFAMGLIARRAQGVVVPMPVNPFALTSKNGVEVPWSETTKTGEVVAVPSCSTEKVPHGVDEPMPTDGV